mgnify:CR=1 FL=1
MNVQQYTFCDVFLISISNNGSKYVELVVNHTTTRFAVKDWQLLVEEIRFGLGTSLNAHIGKRSESHYCTTHQYEPFSVQVGYNNFQLYVLRDTG